MAKRQNRDRPLRLYYTAEEYAQLKQLAAKCCHRTLSSYVRRTSLEKPVVVLLHNASFDRFIDEIIVLRKELAAMKERVEWSTQQKERMVQIQEEIRALINKIATLCMQK